MVVRLDMRGCFGIVALALACSCTTTLPHPPYVPQPASAYVEVRSAPPPARPEVVPPQPSSQAVWIDGEWATRGRRWGWTHGRWVIMPQGTSFALNATMRNEEGAIFYAPGTFRNARGEVAPSPPVLAFGSLSVRVDDAPADSETAELPSDAGAATPNGDGGP